ncbi:hypothetical protein KM1_079390 [Entamoeba histolytica HM-3:IMSS]|uniref:Cellulose synthase n=2 Tax=Entamoeba histolytica TaxID=5759 RepID=A0A175JFQ5_ENTHI|nr:hypothetical protein KM1_079390 [Entamoeba histolytica HM-3:IMSS]GAT92283.1 cellulose synthase [Entamoeba histolytica]GAT92286.1 single tm domain protein [Entamoeba histolytica]
MEVQYSSPLFNPIQQMKRNHKNPPDDIKICDTEFGTFYPIDVNIKQPPFDSKNQLIKVQIKEQKE